MEESHRGLKFRWFCYGAVYTIVVGGTLAFYDISHLIFIHILIAIILFLDSLK